MKLITERDLIEDVANKWNEQYPDDELGVDKLEIGRRLKRLVKKTATADDVEKIIGNRSWTELLCDECEKYVTVVVQVGQESDYDSNTSNLCLECVRKAAKMALQYRAAK